MNLGNVQVRPNSAPLPRFFAAMRVLADGCNGSGQAGRASPEEAREGRERAPPGETSGERGPAAHTRERKHVAPEGRDL